MDYAVSHVYKELSNPRLNELLDTIDHFANPKFCFVELMSKHLSFSPHKGMDLAKIALAKRSIYEV